AIVFFIIASTASGVCSQSGMVRTAFAFVAAARKSSTVFKFSARRSTIPLASKATGTRSEAVFINLVRTEAATDLHRFSRITDGILLNLGFICVHLWRNDREISARVYSRVCRDRPDRTGRDFHGAWNERIERTSQTTGVSRPANRFASFNRVHFSGQNYFQGAWNHRGRLPSCRRSHSARACCSRAGWLRATRSRREQ